MRNQNYMLNSHLITKIDSTNCLDFFAIFSKLSLRAEEDKKSKLSNYSVENWDQNPESLVYTLTKEKRFDEPNGFFQMIHDGKGEPIACGGCYRSDWSKDIWVAGVRTWTNPKYRKDWWHGNILLPNQLKKIEESQGKAMVFTFNEYNKNLLNLLHRISINRTVSLGSNNSDFYKSIHICSDQYQIRATKQKIAVKLITITFEEFLSDYSPPRFKL